MFNFQAVEKMGGGGATITEPVLRVRTAKNSTVTLSSQLLDKLNARKGDYLEISHDPRSQAIHLRRVAKENPNGYKLSGAGEDTDHLYLTSSPFKRAGILSGDYVPVGDDAQPNDGVVVVLADRLNG